MMVEHSSFVEINTTVQAARTLLGPGTTFHTYLHTEGHEISRMAQPTPQLPPKVHHTSIGGRLWPLFYTLIASAVAAVAVAVAILKCYSVAFIDK